jgi:uncharacterized membrane protein
MEYTHNSEKTTHDYKQAHVSLLETWKKARKPIRNANIVHKESLTGLDKFALWITKYVGTMGFFFIIFIWTVVWLSWNTLAPAALRFDPYPAFVLWLFISNMIQIFLMPLIMIGQNLDARHSEARAEADFEVNTKAEQEIEIILTHLEQKRQMILGLIQNHTAQHQELMQRIGQLDPELAQRLGTELQIVNRETSE